MLKSWDSWTIKNRVAIGAIATFTLIVAGCANSGQQSDSELTELRERVAELEVGDVPPSTTAITEATASPTTPAPSAETVTTVLPTTAAPPPDPLLSAPGVIEDGVHYGYLVSSASGSVAFDRADVSANGSWQNSNPQVRTMPYAASVPWTDGTPIEIVVRNQRVSAVNVATAPVPPDPTRIPPGVIEDGVHNGYLVASTYDSFSFDRVDVLADGSWQNTNPEVRTLPCPVLNDGYCPSWPSGTPIQIGVENQRVMWVDSI